MRTHNTDNPKAERNRALRATPRSAQRSHLRLMSGSSSSSSNIMSPRRLEVVKSDEDKRLYRGLVLENGLRTLLISDPETDKSAAAVDVNVGHLSDPEELPGLAHFCEHMLFMGTEKYPDENEYGRFLSQHGGGSNAYTSGEHTNYYFDVSPRHLEAAFDRFAEFFLTPLFTASATDREVLAVNSEHEKNVASDNWRLKQLEHSLCDQTHDYHKFGTGNKETLDTIPKGKGVTVRDELLKFHSRWYSSDIMGLSVLGNQSLDDLEKMVTARFAAVENKKVTPPSWPEHPFRNPEDVRTLTYVVPVKDLRQLNITFSMHDLHPFYKTGPGHYLGHLIGHEGQGSLLSELKRRGWASSLVGGQKHGAKGFAFFIINLDLSLEGINHVDEIVMLVFQYLRLLRDVGPQKWIWEECRDINAMQFRFKDKERPQGYVSSTASDLHDYPIEEVLCGAYSLSEWKPQLITDVIEKLTPENVRVAVIAQQYSDLPDLQAERWYGTKYKTEDIPKEKLKAWGEAETSPALALPPRNEFIPTDFKLAPRDPAGPVKRPEIVVDTPLTRVWYCQDDEFKLPKLNCNFELLSPLAYLTPQTANATAMFVQTFRDDLNEYAYDAELAGLGYSLSSTKHGIALYLRGFSEKQHVLLEKILTRMVSFKPNPERFLVLKEAYQRGLRNFYMEQPHQHAIYYNNLLLSERGWEKKELLDALESLTVEDIEAFVPRLFSSTHIEALVHGNVTEKQATKIVQLVEDKLTVSLGVRPLVPSQLAKDREVCIAPGTSSRYLTTNSVHKSSCIEIYYQQGLQSTKDNARLELLAQIFNEPCFDVLRTKEQLGYIVWSGVRRACGVQGLRVIVQSERHPAYLEGRIEKFLASMEEHIQNMSEEDFEKHRAALIDRRLEKPKKLITRTSEYWSEIVSQQLNFDRDNVEVEEIRKLTRDDVMAFYLSHVKAGSKERKKLVCYVVSLAKGGAGSDGVDDAGKEEEGGEKEEEVSVVQNAVEFRTFHPLHPRPKPFVEASSLVRKDTKPAQP